MTRSEEIKAMIEKSKRSMRSAETLRRDQDYDSAISRFYYAMFYAAEALLFSKGFTFSSHRGVISAFARHFVKTGLFSKEYYVSLNDAFEKRQISDYDFLIRADETTAADLIKKAGLFLAKTEEFLKQGKFI